jgi:ABC-type nitrate/sulfonate/bicarbonate transport system ATPase subunit
MLQMTRQRNTAVLIATHDLHEAAALASRLLVLSAGHLSRAFREWRDSADLEHMLVGTAQ